MRFAPQDIRTFFVTSVCWDRYPFFRKPDMALLLIDVMEQNRSKRHFELHEFVVMPDHFHLLLTPAYVIPLERAVQFIKGGFSFRAKRELGVRGPIWQQSFTEHGIRDGEDYAKHRDYIGQNPSGAGLPDDYPYVSTTRKWLLDPVPPGLKPREICA
jgi:putative transposase